MLEGSKLSKTRIARHMVRLVAAEIALVALAASLVVVVVLSRSLPASFSGRAGERLRPCIAERILARCQIH